MGLCACGCGLPGPGTWRQGHNPKNKGRKFSEEHRQRISEGLRGKLAGPKHPNWGKHLSEETRRKMGDYHRGKTLTPESRRKISETKLSQGISDEACAIHLWLRRHYPKSGVCERCGRVGKTNLASINGHNYTRNREDYAEM